MSIEHFKSCNLYLSAFLYASGMSLVGIERNNSRRADFVFVDTPERAKLVEAYSFAGENGPDVMVDARKFAAAIKALKERLYE